MDKTRPADTSRRILPVNVNKHQVLRGGQGTKVQNIISGAKFTGTCTVTTDSNFILFYLMQFVL